jgi:hypothetical protein
MLCLNVLVDVDVDVGTDVLWVKRELSEVRFLMLQVGSVGATAACCYRLTESDRKGKETSRISRGCRKRKLLAAYGFPYLLYLPMAQANEATAGNCMRACIYSSYLA